MTSPNPPRSVATKEWQLLGGVVSSLNYLRRVHSQHNTTQHTHTCLRREGFLKNPSAMQVFVLSTNATLAACMHCDAHVVKMIVETAQILYTYLVTSNVPLSSGPLVPYKPTHRNHPCVLWLHGGRSHFAWLLELGLALCACYTRLYGKIHKTEAHLHHLACTVCSSALPANCTPKRLLRRLVAHGVSAKTVRACASKVATRNPPMGCAFGVVCSGDAVPHATDADGRIDLVGTYLRFYVYKRTHFKKEMRWNQRDAPPPLLALAWNHVPDMGN